MKTFRIDYRRKWTYFLQHSYSQGWVAVGVGVRCVERYDPVKTAFQFRLRLLRLRSSEIWVVGDTSRSRRTKPITKRGNMHCNWSILPLLLPTTTAWFSLDRKRWSHKRSRKKRKRSDSSDSDSFALMTPLTTPTPTPTLSLVKTNHRPKSIGSSRSTRPSGCTFTCKPSRIRESLFFSSLLCAEELYQFSDTRASLSWLVLQQLFPLCLLTITSFQSTQLLLDFLCLIYHKTH